MVIERIKTILQEGASKIGITSEVTIDIPTQKGFGDYATSIALKSSKLLKKPPLDIAQNLIDVIQKDPLIQKIAVIKPGFINIWINPDEYIASAIRSAKNEFIFPQNFLGENKKVMVEFAHPNTLKLLHIGHMRNLATGESIVRLLEATGNKVIRSNYQGDVGLHIGKTIWKMRHFIKELGSDTIKALPLRDKIALLGKAYSQAEAAFSTNETAKKEILEINRMVYEADPQIMPLWEETRKWSLEYFSEIYKRVYSHHDRLYFESECHRRGTALAQELLKKGILEKSQGAIVFKGEPYGVDTRVFINSQGFPTYEGKELALAEKEFSEFGELDKNIHVVTPEQTSFFKVTFKVEELIDPSKYKDKQYHLAYNWVKLKQGKMSSRLGNVIEGAWLIDEAKKKLQEKFKLDEATVETLAVAAVKYSFLKVSPQIEIYFDFEESISLEGNSAPYLIYTYVRTQSVLEKNGVFNMMPNAAVLNDQDRELVKKLYLFPQAVYESSSRLSPNILATYLFELAQEFNLFYQKNPILKAGSQEKILRLTLTQAVGNTIKEGLRLLGINTVQRM